MRARIVVSGLPASGKSSLAKLLSTALGWPLLDKDAYLESLFAETPPGNAEERNVLSRQADERFRLAADFANYAVLVSWWRHPQSAETSGTPIAWLLEGATAVVEVYCDCPATIALKRFLDRTRHPGHLDGARDRQALAAQFVAAEHLGPLGRFPVVRVDTTRPIDVETLLREVRAHCNSEG